MAFEYCSENAWHDQYFGKGKSLAAASFVCDTPLAVGAHHGALAVAVIAAGDVSIAAGKSVKISVQGSDTENGTFADVVGAPEMAVGASSALAFQAGEVIGKLVLPDMTRYAKIKVTSDATNSGDVDVILSYLAR